MRDTPVLRDVELADRWTDIFRADFPIHFGIMASIAFACFQGFIKDRVGGVLPYTLADGMFVFSFLWWFGSRALTRSAMLVTPRGSMLTTLLLVTLLPALYLIVPGTPFVIQAAGLRAWSLYPIACIIALSTIYNAAQVRAYVGLVLILCAITAIFGILQYEAGPGSWFTGGAQSAARHGSTVFFVGEGGSQQFRAYSTFQFPAPFAGMMVYGMVLAAGFGMSRLRTRGTLVWGGALSVLYFIAMTFSGTRAALVMMAIGLGIMAVVRGLSIGQVVMALPLVAAGHVAVLLTSGHALGRFSTIFRQEGHLWSYVAQPMVLAWQILQEHPLGVGLGRTGVGVPLAITGSMPRGYFIFSDGDIGRAAVDMGVLGLIVLAFMIFGLLPLALRATRVLLGTEDDGLALGLGALVLAGGVILLIGSPLSSQPHGILWWFFLGALVKLALLKSQEEPEEASEDEEPEEVEAVPD